MSEAGIANQLIGDVWPAAEPGSDPSLYGHVELAPTTPVEVRSLQTFTLTYTVGRFGIDDTGSIKVVFRYSADWGELQVRDPRAFNFVTASASNGVPVVASFDSEGHPRPWYQALRVRAVDGYLREGDILTVVFGDRSAGSPGLRMQTFCESALSFKVLVDPCATGLFTPVPATPCISVIPGPPVAWKAILPTFRRPGEPFELGIKAEDLWGNPTDQASETLTVGANLPVVGLPAELTYAPDTFSRRIGGLRVEQAGTLRIEVRGLDGGLLAASNPMVVRDERLGRYWADLHGQSGESIGVNTAREYFEFARERAFLDACSHQANDFQINNAFWSHLNALTREFHDDHRFVTFPGYEWSGNTAVGGDRNVYFRHEGRQIHRSSHALLPEREDLDTDATNAGILFEKLAEEDCVVYAHVGGRWADVSYAHDARLETAMEIHSAWGTFEWLLHDAFEQGFRCGGVCNSDGHKGRPGASYPGASGFHAYGGLTCFIATELTRDGLFDSLRRRHHYGTTGHRLHLDVRAIFPTGGQRFERDPAVFDTTSEAVTEVMMGDIVATHDTRVTLAVEVEAGAPIERVELRNRERTISVHRPCARAALGSRIRITWSGADRRGRGARSRWQGEAVFSQARIERFAKINAWNPERKLEVRGDRQVVWDSSVSGNFAGFDVWLADSREGSVTVRTNHGSIEVPLAEIGSDPNRAEFGGLARELRVQRLPDESTQRAISHQVEVELEDHHDNALWVCVTTEDGHQAWSSPIYVFREADGR